jgi:hypothetical protein
LPFVGQVAEDYNKIWSLSLKDFLNCLQSVVEPGQAVERILFYPPCPGPVAHDDFYYVTAGQWSDSKPLPFLKNYCTIQAVNLKYGLKLGKSDFGDGSRDSLYFLETGLKKRLEEKDFGLDPIHVVPAAVEQWITYLMSIAKEEKRPLEWYV